jgi:hypothetical protein
VIFVKKTINMKRLQLTTLALISVLTLFSCGTKDVASDKMAAPVSGTYGPVKVNVSEAISVKAMLEKFKANPEENTFTFYGEMTEICSKAGCWVNIDKGNGETFMVRFKDHFTIPTNTTPGTGAYFHGVAHWDTVSVDLLRHFAEDAGKSESEIAKITEPKFELGFEADGISIAK